MNQAIHSNPARSRALLRGCACIVLLLASAPAQQRLRFSHITSVEGLSQDIVTSIVRDAHGFMWFGTEDGLNRYDGYEIRTYRNDPLDSASLSGSSVAALFVDGSGRLWVSTNGLDVYDERTDGFIHFRHTAGDASSLPDNHVPALCQDSSGVIWAGTDRGLARLDDSTGRWVGYRHDPANSATLSSDLVLALFVDRAKTLWIGTDHGLDRYDPSTDSFVRSSLPPGSAGVAAVNSIFEGTDGGLWLGTRGRGLMRVDVRSGRAVQLIHDPRNPNSPGDNLVFTVTSDQRGRLWIGHFAGLDVYDPSTRTFDHYVRTPEDPDGLVGDRVYSIFPDRTGAVWLGTYHGGVERYDPFRQRFDLIRPSKLPHRGLPDQNVLSILVSTGGRVWVGTQSGLVVSGPLAGRLTGDRLVPVRNPGDHRNAVLSLLEDRRGTIWVGYDRPRPLQRLDRAGRSLERFPYTGVRALRQDRRGDIWIGMQPEGLVRLSPRTKRATWFRNQPDSPDSLWGDGVWSIFEDSHGLIWVGTAGRNECLNRFDPHTGRFTHFSNRGNGSGSIPGGSIRSIVEARSGELWFGHWGGGLSRFDPSTGRVVLFTRVNGLPSNYVKAIQADEHGVLWISTEKGIARFEPATSSVRAYSTEDGLQGDRFYSASAATGPDGTMYFGGDHGLNVFHPGAIRDNTEPPTVRITSFKVFDKPVELPNAVGDLTELSRSYDEDFISFEFVALDYTSPARNRYAYKLEGLQRAWTDPSDRRYAAFTHLNPGTYTFRVKAANADGIWNEEGASIRLVIAPPFWATAWFRTLAVLAIATVLYLLYRMRVSRLLSVERLRQRIAQDLHDEIGTNLSTIALATGGLLRRRGLGAEARTTLNRIGAVTQRTADQMKDIVWVLKTENDSLDHLVAKMREIAGHLLIGTRYRFDAPSEALLDKVNLDFKRNVFLFYKESLNNIARHAKATEVTIRVDHTNGVFTLLVEDNGRGFDGTMHARGSGLQNLKSRAESLGGTVDITSFPGKGTRVMLAVKTTRMRHGFLMRGRVG